MSLAWKYKKIFLQSISTKTVQNGMLKVFDADWHHLESWCNKINLIFAIWNENYYHKYIMKNSVPFFSPQSLDSLEAKNRVFEFDHQ